MARPARLGVIERFVGRVSPLRMICRQFYFAHVEISRELFLQSRQSK